MSELNPLIWDKRQRMALCLSAVIGALVLVIWHPPGISNASTCLKFGPYYEGWCREMWRDDVAPTLFWIVLGAAMGTAVVYVVRLMRQ